MRKGVWYVYRMHHPCNTSQMLMYDMPAHLLVAEQCSEPYSSAGSFSAVPRRATSESLHMRAFRMQTDRVPLEISRDHEEITR